MVGEVNKGTGGSGSSNWIDLLDTPSTFTGQALKNVRVNSAADAIEFISPVAVGGEFEQEFTSDTGFTYDSDKAEFSAGAVQQTDQRPSNIVLSAKFTSSIDADYGISTLTGTAVGSAAVSGGKLDLAHNDLRYVHWSGANVTGTPQVGTFELGFIANYNGSPAGNQYIRSECKAVGDTKNQIELIHLTSGQLRLTMKDSSGTNIFASNLGAFSPVLGTTYKIKLTYDVTVGSTKLYVAGGVYSGQFGVTQTATGTRDTNVGCIVIGTDCGGITASNFSVDSMADYSVVTTDGVDEAPEYIYNETIVELPRFSHTGTGSIDQLLDMSHIYTGSPKYIFNGQYWNGSAWVASSDTYATAASRADSVTNFDTFIPEDYLDIKVIFPDAQSPASLLDNLVIDYGVASVFTEGTPASASATGVKGTVLYDSSYIYVCIATDTWKRVGISTW